jgi:hypothetical protein
VIPSDGGEAAALPVDPGGGRTAGGVVQHPIVTEVGHVEIAAAVQGDTRKPVRFQLPHLQHQRNPWSWERAQLPDPSEIQSFRRGTGISDPEYRD